jgi:hypothetical protein
MINKRIVLIEKSDTCHNNVNLIVIANFNTVARADVVGIEMKNGIHLVKSRWTKAGKIFKSRARFYKEAIEKC